MVKLGLEGMAAGACAFRDVEGAYDFGSHVAVKLRRL